MTGPFGPVTCTAETGANLMTEPNASTAIPPVDEKLLEQAVAWTRAAGELTLGGSNHPELGVEHKHDGSPVTAADRAAERLLREEIAAALPDDTVRGEERAIAPAPPAAPGSSTPSTGRWRSVGASAPTPTSCTWRTSTVRPSA